jgi:hypothetical protein
MAIESFFLFFFFVFINPFEHVSLRGVYYKNPFLRKILSNDNKKKGNKKIDKTFQFKRQQYSIKDKTLQ